MRVNGGVDDGEVLPSEWHPKVHSLPDGLPTTPGNRKVAGSIPGLSSVEASPEQDTA